MSLGNVGRFLVQGQGEDTDERGRISPPLMDFAKRPAAQRGWTARGSSERDPKSIDLPFIQGTQTQTEFISNPGS